MNEIESIREFFEYNNRVRTNYMQLMIKDISWEEFVKNRETSWLSLKDTMLHIIWVNDSWINYSINGLEDPNRPFPFAKYSTWDSIMNYNLMVASKVTEYLSKLTPVEMSRIVSRVNNDGIKRTIKVRDVLLHVFGEELHHRGEIIAMLWQMNRQPPDMGWASVMKKTYPSWKMT